MAGDELLWCEAQGIDLDEHGLRIPVERVVATPLLARLFRQLA
jgi:hypothetical protein